MKRKKFYIIMKNVNLFGSWFNTPYTADTEEQARRICQELNSKSCDGTYYKYY